MDEERFSRPVIKMPRKDKHGTNGINNFQPITLLNTVTMILTKVSDNGLQAALCSLFYPELLLRVSMCFESFTPVKEGISDNRLLSSKALYRLLVRCGRSRYSKG